MLDNYDFKFIYGPSFFTSRDGRNAKSIELKTNSGQKYLLNTKEQ